MAKRRKKEGAPKKAAAAADPEPFNNPFAADLKTLTKQLRAAKAARAAQAAERKQPSEPVRGVARGDDREEFFAAVAGSTPMTAKRSRVRNGERTPVAIRADESAHIDFTADEHFDVRFSDRYIRASADGVSNETIAKLERGEFAVRSHVDLHGMALDDARRAVDEFLFDRHRHGERCVLVITGKGRNSRRQVGVLREQIPQWLARGPSARRVLAFVTARPCDGGEGALYVLLRKHAAAKTRIDVLAGSGA
jgi:DNA-nicking Smr family endonuclease